MYDDFTSIKAITIANIKCGLKMEKENPAGSHKSRIGEIIARQLKFKKIKRAVVSSSGNFALAIAFFTQHQNLRLRVVYDTLSSLPLIGNLAKFSHVELVKIDEPDATGSHLQARLRYIKKLTNSAPWFFIDQYDNRTLPVIYEHTLGPELLEQTNQNISSIFAPAGTGAMVKGIADFFSKCKPEVRVFAVDAMGSALYGREPKKKRNLPGYGNGKPTGLSRASEGLISNVICIEDLEALRMCHTLKNDYDLLVGPSSGAAVAAFLKVIQYYPELIPDRGMPTIVCPDGGENYEDSVYSTSWCKKTFNIDITEFEQLNFSNFVL